MYSRGYYKRGRTLAIILVIMTVLIHNEVLMHLSKWMRIWKYVRLRFSLAVLVVIFTHIFEIGLFSIGYYVFLRLGNFGTLTGDAFNSIGDVGYYSFVTYTSLGYGDITPTGSLRFMAELEVLTGLVMLAWTASFFFVFMSELWKNRQ